MPNPRVDGGDKGSIPPSTNLWIGNLTEDTSEGDLRDLFGRYGVVDSVTNYSSRNFAFVYYKRVEDARSAKESLQNALLRGNNIRIEFARPAKPAKNLWIGCISLSVTKEQLEDELLQYGKIKEFKFLRDRNSALVEYYRLDDAAAAVKNMNGRRLGGEQIRVDYLRSQSHHSRKENWLGSHDSRDGNFTSRSIGPPEYWVSPDAHLGGQRDGPPSRVLWVVYPPSVQIDEHMLHNAMILFGEIENIRSFPARHYSFVEFRSVDEARRAKEGLQGRLFNDPRIRIMFSSSELAPHKDQGFFAGIRGPRPDMFFNDLHFGPGPMDFFGHNRPVVPNNLFGPLTPNGMPGPNMLLRPFGPEDFNDLAGLLHNFEEVNPNSVMGQSWRRASPAPGLIPSPVQGMQQLSSIRPMPGTWDDSQTFHRESKRSRIAGHSPFNDISVPARIVDDQRFGFDPQLDRGASAPASQGQNRHSPLGVGVPSGEVPDQVRPDSDICWRGIIAKGGTPVCHARCVPIGNGLDTQLPEIVNCSARTGLDMLEKHYTEASGFDIVFFLPDSEADFASYTEFLHYLGAKNRAGVAKFEDGTTLFLIPPSDFLTKVLNISGPERLYGVVLKLRHQKPSATVHQQQCNPPPQLSDRHQRPPLPADYSRCPPKDDPLLQLDYTRVPHESAMSHLPKSSLPPNEESPSMHSVPQDYRSNPASMPQSGLSLTPELIATLASLLPKGMQSSTSTNAQIPLDSSAMGSSSFSGSVTQDKVTPSQVLRQGHQASFPSTPNHSREEQAFSSSQQLGYQFDTQPPFTSQSPSYLNVMNNMDNSHQGIPRNSQTQHPSHNVPQQTGASSGSANNFTVPSHGGQFTIPQQSNQQFQIEASPQKGYGTGNTNDGPGIFHSSVNQQPKPSGTPSTQVQGMNIPLPGLGMSSINDGANTGLPDGVQQLQSALSGVGQGTAASEAEKNQRYQSTLQFAANLLLQIQQRQQQGGTQASNGSGNHS